MALHGSATIELTNADGSKEVIKHDNMITNAVNDLLKSQRGELATIMKHMKNGESYAQALFGGILLFGETLDTDANKYFLPTTNIVGYASQDAYGGLDVARGSFNESEGGLQEDGSYKFVWDFATSQANGKISSIALCPNIMGQIGASDSIVNSESKKFEEINGVVAPFNTNGYMLNSNGSTEGIENYYFFVVAVIGDIAYCIDKANVYYDSNYSNRYFKSNGNILKLYRFKLGANNISVNNYCGMATYLDAIDVQIPSDFIDALSNSSGDYPLAFWFNSRDKKLIVFPCCKKSDIEVNGTTKYIEIELANNNTVNTYTFTNNTGGKIMRGGYNFDSSYEQSYTMFICNDYIVNFSIVGSENKMYVTKKSDNTIVKEVKYSDSNGFGFSSKKTLYFAPVFCRDNILVFSYRYENSKCYYYILDMETGIIKKTNAQSLSNKCMVDIGEDSVFARTYTYMNYRLMMNPFVLTTKNNLDSPVTKTSSQTMKITYTLKESEAV